MFKITVNVNGSNRELMLEMEKVELKDRAERMRMLASIGLMVVKGSLPVGMAIAPVMEQKPEPVKQQTAKVARRLLGGL